MASLPCSVPGALGVPSAAHVGKSPFSMLGVEAVAVPDADGVTQVLTMGHDMWDIPLLTMVHIVINSREY